MKDIKKIIEEEMNKIGFNKEVDRSDEDVFVRKDLLWKIAIGVEKDYIYVRSELIEKIIDRCVKEYVKPKFYNDLKKELGSSLEKYNESILKELDKNLNKLIK